MAARDDTGAETLFLHHHELYANRVFAFFLRRGFDEQESRDLTQDVFLRVWKSRGTLRTEAAAGSWILRIAVNVWKNELRRRQAQMRAAPETSLEAQMEHGEPIPRPGPHPGSQPPPNPLDSTLSREQGDLARQVLRQMAPQRRRCLWLHGGRQLKYREIGELLGLSIEAVKSHIHQGRRQLREELQRRFASGKGP